MIEFDLTKKLCHFPNGIQKISFPFIKLFDSNTSAQKGLIKLASFCNYLKRKINLIENKNLSLTV